MPEIAQSGLSTRFYAPGSSEFPILLEHYEIHGIIGEGGMGRVFKAYHLNLKRFVAIKTLRIDHRSGSDLVGRFKQEMELVGQMDHPNVVRASDAGEKNGIFYLVMEYLSGCDLSHLATRKGRLESAFACELISQAALGLDYIHDKTLIHRDIKPSNLMLTTAGQLKILDLGLARFDLDNADRHEKTPNGYAVGTYAYMAPEQATAGRQVDGRADIYGLGCTLFKLLTGRTPYSGPEYDNVAKVLNAHSTVPLSSVDGFQLVPENLRDVLLKMTAKDPDHRYRSGREVAEALMPFFGDITGSAMQPHAVVVEKEDIAETPVRRLTDPLPEELSRLTGSIHETPQNTRAAPPTSAAVIEPQPAKNRRRWVIAGGVLALVLLVPLLVAAYHSFRDPVPPELPTPTPNASQPLPEEPKEGFRLPLPLVLREIPLRSLDKADPGEEVHLLKHIAHPPTLIGFREGSGLASGHWFPSQQKFAISPTDPVVIQLGHTTRRSFTFNTSIYQPIWSGKFGLIWGYREDARVKRDKLTTEDFAWFQMLHMIPGQDQKGPYFSIVRATGGLRYHPTDGTVMRGHIENFTPAFRLPVISTEKTFQIEIEGARLKRATFAGNDLSTLCTPALNKKFTPQQYEGAFGVITYSANVTIRHSTFVRHPDN